MVTWQAPKADKVSNFFFKVVQEGFTDQMSYVKTIFRFRASLWYLRSGKKSVVIRPAVPEMLEGVCFYTPPLPPDASKLSKRADEINR